MSNLLAKKRQQVYGVKFTQEGEGQKFDKNELEMMSSGEVVLSPQTGNTQVKINFTAAAGGGYVFFGLNRATQLALGDKVDFSKMKVYTYVRQEWDKNQNRYVKHEVQNMLEDHLTPESPSDED